MGRYIGGDGSTENNTTNVTVQWADVGAFMPGDLALLFWTHNSASTETTLPTGFTSVDSQTDNNVLMSLWSKVLTGTETGNVTCGLGGAARHSVAMVVLRGYSGIHLVTKAADTGTDAIHTAPAATPTIPGVGVIIANGERIATGSSSMTAPAGYTTAAIGSAVGTAGSFTGTAYEGSAGFLQVPHDPSVAINPGDMTNNAAASDVSVMTVLLTPVVNNFFAFI